MRASPHPVLSRLGFDAGDRVAIVHADDVGLCQATLPAFADLLDAGLVSSGSVMVPAPAFPAAVDFARAHPEADLGVHLTITSEWPACRWGPLTTPDPRSGLLDGDGAFPATSAELAGADPEAVGIEIEAQVARAEAAGIDVTHLDVHMLTLLSPRLLPLYRDLAARRRLPVPVLRPLPETLPPFPADGNGEALGLAGGPEEGLGICDLWVVLRLKQPEERIEQAKRLFKALPPGLTHVSIHPAVDTPELRALASDWRCRVADYEAFVSAELRRFVAGLGVRVVGYGALRGAASL
ncbi:MAG TPA: polysaccharide deacetylase family protein [Thermoanaerobaculia bacterium]|nr:polysaccharide deacetylase family protein [Thermoanaerobaculia bacterium]